MPHDPHLQDHPNLALGYPRLARLVQLRVEQKDVSPTQGSYMEAKALRHNRVHRTRAGVIRPEWFDEASCEDLPREAFFIDGHDSNLALAAKLLCMGCPVRLRCLAIGITEYHGIFGGTTNLDRTRIRKQMGHRNFSLVRFLDELDKRTVERAEARDIEPVSNENYKRLAFGPVAGRRCRYCQKRIPDNPTTICDRCAKTHA